MLVPRGRLAGPDALVIAGLAGRLAPTPAAAEPAEYRQPRGAAADRKPAGRKHRRRRRARRRRPAAGPLDGREGRDLALDRFRPRSMLKVDEHLLQSGEVSGGRRPFSSPRAVSRKSADCSTTSSRSWTGRTSPSASASTARWATVSSSISHYLWDKYRDRFVIFANIDWQGDGQADDPATWDCQRPDFGRRMARQLAETKAAGACGLKVFKDFGLVYRNPDGSRIRIDDPRWDPIWAACGELGMPVLDPRGRSGGVLLADRRNERTLGRTAAASRLEFFRSRRSFAPGPARRAADGSAPGIGKPPSSAPTWPAMPKTWRRSAAGWTSIRICTSTLPPGSPSWAGSRTPPASS